MTIDESTLSSKSAKQKNAASDTVQSQLVCPPTIVANQKQEIPIRYYCNGSGARRDGKSAAYAWERQRDDTSPKAVHWIDHPLTDNQAEYMAILSALEDARPSSNIEILINSKLIIDQLNGIFRVNDTHLLSMYHMVSAVIRKRQLNVNFLWIPRSLNEAAKLIYKLEKAEKVRSGPQQSIMTLHG